MEEKEVTTQEVQAPKKKGGKVIGILLLIVILVAGGVAGYFVLTKGKESKNENTKTEEKQEEKKNERKGPIVPAGEDIREELESVFKRDFDKDAKHMTVPADDFDEEDEDVGCASSTDKYEYGDYVVSIFQEECLGTVEITIYDKEGKELRKLDDIFAFVYEDGDTDVSNDIVCSPIIVDGRLYYIRTSDVDSEDTIPNYLEYIDLKDNLKTEVIKEYQLYHGVE